MSRLRRMIDRLKRKNNSQIARDLGVRIGNDCCILSDPYVCFGSEPYLVEIGNHVEITGECRFVTHDGALWVLRQDEECKKLDKFGKITIGNNVFIGLRSTIMPGVTVGDNSIIGACSLVNKSVPAGEVWAGVPAKRICSLDEYKEKILKTSDATKGLPQKEKEATIRKLHPEWF